MEEDEMHMLFLCHFSKAAWFSHPWYIRTEMLAATHQTIPDMIQFLLSSNHPHISTINLYTFLWCLWKVRNDYLFNRKNIKPEQVFVVYNAVMQDTDTSLMKELHVHDSTWKGHHGQPEQLKLSTVLTSQSTIDFPGTQIYSDAAWSLEPGQAVAKAGIGVFLQINGQHTDHLYISAVSPPVASALQAEAYGLLLAVKIAAQLHVQDPKFLTDSEVLASAVVQPDITKAGPWAIRPILAAIQTTPSFHPYRILKVHRSLNFKAHHQARLAVKVQDKPFSSTCLHSDQGLGTNLEGCPTCNELSAMSAQPLELLFVKCA